MQQTARLAGKTEYGFNVWDLFDATFAGEIPCNRAETFFHLLYASSTRAIVNDACNVGQGWADLTLYGPITDDAAEESTKKLTEAEVSGGTRYVGFEAMACLKATFRLYIGHIDHLFTDEEKDSIVERFRELGLNGTKLDLTCKALRLRRVR